MSRSRLLSNVRSVNKFSIFPRKIFFSERRIAALAEMSVTEKSLNKGLLAAAMSGKTEVVKPNVFFIFLF